ncbi:hypothetical protein HGRIS_001843 [Hohenbuehelia grisea]|uniref:Uncharacterized protein n=1 Tax=Hohenbuehelia grisea TaxID=104357 RepID=A0ABR3JIM0_9AGAR
MNQLTNDETPLGCGGELTMEGVLFEAFANIPLWHRDFLSPLPSEDLPAPRRQKPLSEASRKRPPPPRKLKKAPRTDWGKFLAHKSTPSISKPESDPPKKTVREVVKKIESPSSLDTLVLRIGYATARLCVSTELSTNFEVVKQPIAPLNNELKTNQ